MIFAKIYLNVFTYYSKMSFKKDKDAPHPEEEPRVFLFCW
jgi:hypothetical protein